MLQSDQIAAIIVPAFFMMIPIVAILTKHQRNMAMIMRSDRNDAPKLPVVQPDLERQIADLRELVAQQTIALDTLSRTTQAMAQRLEEGQTTQFGRV